MKTPMAIMLALVAFLLLSGLALAQSGEPDPPTWYTVERGPALSVVEGAASGGGYHLTSLALRQAQGDTWQVEGSASGAGYRLLPALSGAEGGPASPTLRGNGCCCIWIPGAVRNY